MTRQIYTGAGKVGTETPTLGGRSVPYQLSQRSEFFEEEIGLETTLKRPIVNTRDEPHADPQRYRRLHVIVGDANLAEVATFLKIGATALVLALIEDDGFDGVDLTHREPGSGDQARLLRHYFEHAPGDGRRHRLHRLEIQWELFSLARKYAEDRGLECLGDEAVGRDVLERWESVLHGLETDPVNVARQVDWVAKLQLIEGYRDRHNLDWDDHRLAAVDLQYHDLRPERSLFARLDTEHLVSEQDVLSAVTEPPRRTRAYFRGQCLKRWASSVASANWDSIVFDLGTDPLRRVPMMDPLRGTAEHTEELLKASSSPADLLTRLSA